MVAELRRGLVGEIGIRDALLGVRGCMDHEDYLC